MKLLEDPDLLNKVNYYIDYAREYSMSKWGRKIPMTHAIIDIPTTYRTFYEKLNVDVFTTNAGYRGQGFGDLWDGPDGLGELSRQYNKPNFIGEMGWHQINGQETANLPGKGIINKLNLISVGWFNFQWKDLLTKGIPNGCVGGCFFEYLDEIHSKGTDLSFNICQI